MRMIKMIYGFIIFITFLFAASCKKDTPVIPPIVQQDTTSHLINWVIDDIGNYGSYLLDVAIIDENNIWAVGEIYMNDSLGNPDLHAYNAAHWDGSGWGLKRILFPTVCGSTNRTPYPSKSIFAFQDGEIWIGSSGDNIAILENGVQVSEFCLPSSLNMGINKIWGTSSEDLYVVGNEGNIAHYQNGVWTKIESGTDLDLTDIYGDSEGNLYAAGVDIALAKGVVVKGNQSGIWEVMIEGDIIDESELFDKLFGRIGTLWVDELGTLYAGADFLYHYKNMKWDYVRSLPENYIGGDQYYIGYLYSLRGNKSNDIVICGDRNTLRHFNGVEWTELGIPYLPYRHIFWRSVKIKENTIVSVGSEETKAQIILLKR